jgi:hypothetical protein
LINTNCALLSVCLSWNRPQTVAAVLLLLLLLLLLQRAGKAVAAPAVDSKSQSKPVAT